MFLCILEREHPQLPANAIVVSQQHYDSNTIVTYRKTVSD